MSIAVSWVVPAFRAADTLPGAVRSALADGGEDIEVIVVDDASPDDTAAVAEALAAGDPRVRVLSMERNGGPSAARNAAVAVARGRFVGVLDADDTIAPARTRRLLDLADLTNADVVADDLVRLDESGAVASRALPEGPQPYSFVVDPIGYCRDNVPMAGGFGTGYLKPLFSREFLTRTGIRYDEAVRVGEDFLICLEALLAGARYVVSSHAGYRYASRPGSLSHRIVAERLAELDAGLIRLAARRADVLDTACEAAIEDYRAGLARARDYLETVEQAKDGRPLAALGRAVRSPALWPLAARFGAEAVANRVVRRRPGS